MDLDKLLSSIATRIKYIANNAQSSFVVKEAGIVDKKLDDVRNRVIKTPELLNQVCDKIISVDIYNMRHVLGETNMVYKKVDELEAYIVDLKAAYFNQN